MSDRQAFPFDGAGDFSRAAVMIRYHARVSNDASVWVPPGGLLSQKGARNTVSIQLNSDITDIDDQEDDEYDDNDDYFGSKMSKMFDIKTSVQQRLHCSKARGTKGDSDTKPWIYSVCVYLCVRRKKEIV